MKKNAENVKKAITKGVALAAVFAALRFAGQQNFCFALCFGLYVAALSCGAGLIPASCAYALSGCFFGLDVLLYTAVSVVPCVLILLLLKALRKSGGARSCVLLLVAGQIFFLAYATPDLQTLAEKAVCSAVCVLFFAVSLLTLKSVVIRGLKYRLDDVERACVCVFVICLALGLANVAPWGFSVLRLVGGFAVPASLFVFGNFTCLMTALLLGAGSAFGTGVLTDAAVFALWGVAAVAFRKIKPLCALAIPLVDLAVSYFFGGIVSVEATAALAAGCFVFLCLPSSVFKKLNDKFGRNEENYAVRSIVNRTKNNVSRKLYDLSEIFFEMKLSFMSMVKGVMPREQAKIVLSKEVSEEVCRDCPERSACWKNGAEKTEKAFLTMMEGAMDRGKATVFDLPNSMTQKCKRLNSVLSAVNQSVERYKNYYAIATNNDNSRMLIGEQLAGVSQIMRSLSRSASEQSVFDRRKEAKLFEELTRDGVLVKEAVVASEGESLCVTLVVENGDNKKKCVGEAVSRVCGIKMMLSETQATQSRSWVVMTFVPSPAYDVIFGFAALKKHGSEVSGDTHSFLRISEHKFLLSLCDGMGSGPAAEKASGTAISLIENFYKAGFDNTTILSGVNRLLSLSQDEVFTAVDICVVDLHAGSCDFIKIGAPCGFVKNANNVEIIAAGSLPLGVLEEMKPCITQKALCDGDVIVLASDGVTDAFETKEKFAQTLGEIALKTPQETADILLKAAVDREKGEVKDDMTVIVAQMKAL